MWCLYSKLTIPGLRMSRSESTEPLKYRFILWAMFILWELLFVNSIDFFVRKKKFNYPQFDVHNSWSTFSSSPIEHKTELYYNSPIHINSKSIWDLNYTIKTNRMRNCLSGIGIQWAPALFSPTTNHRHTINPTHKYIKQPPN